MKKIQIFILVLISFLFIVSGCKKNTVPKIYSITPTTGLVNGGNKVSIYGENLPDDLSVYFGDNKATVESHSDSTVVVTVPKGKVGEVYIYIKDNSGTDISSNFKYTYYEEEVKNPIISGLSIYKALVTGGEKIAIYGQNFANDAKVYFGDKEATIETVDAILITCVIPSGNIGKVDITVENPSTNKEYTLKDSFEYYDEQVKSPKIIGLSINQGYLNGGETVTIYGENFSNNIEVYFGSKKATIKAKSENLIIVTVPSTTTAGAVAVKVTDTSTTLSHSLSNAYTYVKEVLPELKVTGISSSEGNVAGGEQVTIFGKNFPSSVEVYFGSKKATITSNDDSVIIVKTPASSKGTVDVKVKDTTNNKESVLSNAYTYIEEVPQELKVTGISSSEGNVAGGEQVTIFGKNFPLSVEVYFGSKKATITSNDDSVIIVKTPASSKGTVDVKVKDLTNNKESVLSNAYTYRESLISFTITGITSNKGSIDGGEVISIFGTNFTTDMVVLFGDVSATVKSYSSTALVVETPSQSEGIYDVTVKDTVTNQTVTLAQSYEYYVEVLKLEIALNPGVDTVELFSNYIDAGATARFGTKSVQVTVESYVDITKIGQYFVYYSATYEGVTVQIRRSVMVIDETAPVLRLNSGIDTVILGTKWVDAGVTVVDNSNEILTANVESNVNIDMVGEYTVTYTATDSSGNTSTIVRYVNVIEAN